MTDEAEIDAAATAFFKHAKITDINAPYINLTGKDVTDEQLQYLQRLPKLNWLILTNNPKITDNGLQHIAGLDKINTLILDKTQVTDAGMECLKDTENGLRNLTHISLDDTRVNKEMSATMKAFCQTNLERINAERNAENDVVPLDRPPAMVAAVKAPPVKPIAVSDTGVYTTRPAGKFAEDFEIIVSVPPMPSQSH